MGKLLTNELEEELRRMGFRDCAEYQRMMAQVDLSRPMGKTLFDAWLKGNGTKAGLQEVIRLAGGRNG